VRRYAISISVAGFFVMAAVGLLCGVPVFVCGLRAAGGAVALYVMIRVAAKVLLKAFVDAMVRDRNMKENAGEPRI
jgi:hypothetical protein